MLNQTQLTPGRKYFAGINAKTFESNVLDRYSQKTLQQSIRWGALNFCLLSIILYDIINTSPVYVNYVQYIEYVGVVILSLNILYHLITYIKIHMILNKNKNDLSKQPISPQGTPIKNQIRDVNTPLSVSQTPINLSATSWMSNYSAHESANLSLQSTSWTFAQGSPKTPTTKTPVKAIRQNTSDVGFINDENGLSTYLKDFDAHEKVNTLSRTDEINTTNVLNSFWTHPTAKAVKDVSAFLKRCHYQLSTPTASGSFSSPNFTKFHQTQIPNYFYGSNSETAIQKYVAIVKPLHEANMLVATTPNSPKSDDSSCGSPIQGVDTWRRLHVDSLVLTQWNANLRIWLSQTILNTLVKEFDSIDECLQKHGFGDIQIGKVGLERLRKTAQTMPVLQFIQTLPIVIPFLELTPNQEYLVKRIRELAKGGCMSDFKWNSGSNFNGKEWDNNLPTDCAIVMHLFASYLDTQLQPLPNQPEVKGFSGYHYIKLNETLVLNANTLAIQQCSEYPPHYKVIVGEEVFELVKGYNNLFHSILLFLYYVNKKEHGMLGQVNLGRSGVNLLWVIKS
ncbi:transmembrane protein 209 isoform X2 [Onthophagus taurus]|uniref:transmembrane protein 209 isoform X2 n=1 Tax=Onthophagus taurus TaxID=166361 RepID=UPI0039BDBE22